MSGADGVDARARRVAARLLPTRIRRSGQRSGDGSRGGSSPRHSLGGHPARAARIAKMVQAMQVEGWASLGPVHRPGGGARLIDHVMIGPGGVVVLDSQAWVGRVEVTRGMVQQNGFWRESECADVARTAGSIAALLLPRHRTAVHAVICVAQHELAEHRVAPGVHVVGVSGLAKVLRALPTRLTPVEVHQIHTHLRHLVGEGAPPEQLTTAGLDGPARLVRPVPAEGTRPQQPGPAAELFVPVDRGSLPSAARAAERGGRRWRPRRGLDWRLLVARLLLALLVVIGAVMFGPGLLSRPVPDHPNPPIGTVVPGPVVPYAPDAAPFPTPPAATAHQVHREPL